MGRAKRIELLRPIADILRPTRVHGLPRVHHAFLTKATNIVQVLIWNVKRPTHRLVSTPLALL